MHSSVKSLISRSQFGDQMLCRLNPRSVACSFVVAPFQRNSQVVIDRIAVRIHLCADTGSALGLYFGDFGTAFKERLDQPYVFGFDWLFTHVFHPHRNSISESQPRKPTVVSAKRSSLSELACEIQSLRVYQSLTCLVQTPSISMRFEASRKWVRHQI